MKALIVFIKKEIRQRQVLKQAKARTIYPFERS
jgi:hypothetical protein